MPIKKGSELLFEKLCERKGVTYRNIKEDSEKGRKPDYFILPNNELIVVEIKQFERSERDKQIWANLKKGVLQFFAVKTRYKIADKIKDGKGQLKPFSSRPTILIILDNTGGFSSLDKSEIYDATHGRNSMLPKHRTNYISAIGRLEIKVPEAKGELDIFHNQNTTNPLDPASLKGFARKQFRVKNTVSDPFSDN